MRKRIFIALFGNLFGAVALALAGVVALLWLLDGSRVALAQSGTGVIRVATTGNDTPGCGSPITPCLTVQYAVDQAQAGVDEIRVAAGTYTDIHVRAGITQVVYISKTVTIRGGYTTTNWTAPYPITQPTTLDAQEQGRVLYITGDISPTIEGLRITGGDAAGLGGGRADRAAGGGVYVITATATIRDNQVFSNTAECGGGVHVMTATATIRDNQMFSNTADFRGGGLYLEYSDATLSGNTVISNTANNAGGGLCLQFSDVTLSSNTISSNAAAAGGGLRLKGSDATLSGNTISSNTATTDGGGLYLDDSDATLSGNTVAFNTANDDGGGLCLKYSDNVTLTGNTIISNTANGGDSYGGGLRLFYSAATLSNNVVADNQATFGSGICVEGCSPRLLHTTIARNSESDGIGVYVTKAGSNYSTVTLTNTVIVSHTVGINVTVGNTATLESTLWHGNTTDWSGSAIRNNDYTGDPRFDADGYHLMAGSVAINRGVNAGVTTDIDGDSRDSAPDLGADERPGTGIYLPIILKNASP